jgi:hypothetical protein
MWEFSKNILKNFFPLFRLLNFIHLLETREVESHELYFHSSASRGQFNSLSALLVSGQKCDNSDGTPLNLYS